MVSRRSVLALALALASIANAGPERVRERPHVVFILADDLGFTDLPV